MTYRTSHLPMESDVLTSDLQWLTYFNYYAQKDPITGKTETWTQAIARAADNLRILSNNLFDNETYQELHDAMFMLKVLPSMRLLSMTTAAIQRCNTVLYNCCFLPIDTFQAIAEMLYLTMSGVGVGYSVEAKAINNLPSIPSHHEEAIFPFIVPDTQMGWAKSIVHLFEQVLTGWIPTFDYSKVRPAGTPLETKGGVASGPAPLEAYHNHILNILKQAKGRQLRSIEVHDIVNMVSECAISNGSRSGALICIFDDNDKDMLGAKSDPEWYNKTPWRAYSNNSVAVNGTTYEFIDGIIDKLIYDESGDPGLFSRAKFDREATGITGCNPCGEVLLNSTPSNGSDEQGGGQFCNLSTVVLHKESIDNPLELENQLRLATLIGTIQSAATDFRFLRDDWKANCDRERLLGVCITGIYDYKEHFNAEQLQHMQQTVQNYNETYAQRLGINASASVTSVKPSGNTSVLTDTSPGINPDFGRYQMRNVRVGKHSKMAKFLIEHDVPYADDPFDSNNSKYVFSFPRQSKSNNTLQTTTVQEQIDNYLLWATHYTTHNVSVTITYKEHEKEWLAAWIKDNYTKVTGMAFFPETPNMPYLPIQVITDMEYYKAFKHTDKIDWREYYDFEGEHVKQTIAECSGDRCDIVW